MGKSNTVLVINAIVVGPIGTNFSKDLATGELATATKFYAKVGSVLAILQSKTNKTKKSFVKVVGTQRPPGGGRHSNTEVVVVLSLERL